MKIAGYHLRNLEANHDGSVLEKNSQPFSKRWWNNFLIDNILGFRGSLVVHRNIMMGSTISWIVFGDPKVWKERGNMAKYRLNGWCPKQVLGNIFNRSKRWCLARKLAGNLMWQRHYLGCCVCRLLLVNLHFSYWWNLQFLLFNIASFCWVDPNSRRLQHQNHCLSTFKC